MNNIILIHGYLDNWWTPWWFRNKMKLEKMYNIDVSIVRKRHFPLTNTKTFVENAKNIGKVVEKYNENVDIIGHSMGGLEARWYVERLEGDKQVDNLITFGTPHKGTRVASLALITSGGIDMRENSPTIKKLNADGIEESVNYTAFWSNRDELVCPSTNAMIPFDNAKNIEITESHFTMQARIPSKIERLL